MDTFSTRSLILQAQKKVLGSVASKAVVGALLDDASSAVLDELYRASRAFTRSRREARRALRDAAKLAVKLALLVRAGLLDAAERDALCALHLRARGVALTALSFHQVAFTFDRRVLVAGLHECRELLLRAAGQHLGTKSHGRIARVFGHFGDPDFLSALFGMAEPFPGLRGRLCAGLERMLDEGAL